MSDNAPIIGEPKNCKKEYIDPKKPTKQNGTNLLLKIYNIKFIIF